MLPLSLIGFAAALLFVLILTPFVKKFAIFIGAVDAPNERKVHKGIMPRLGGLGIFIAFVGAFFIIAPALDGIKSNAAWGLLIGGTVIIITGALDDRFELSAKVKLIGIVIAAFILVGFGLRIDLVNLPFMGSSVQLDWLSIPLTILWIVGVTNAINLIDGLDGLAAGVSGISTATILIMAIMMGNVTVILLSAILLGCVVGFLFFNFHPAKIFMGDSGALFLGFSIATLSILGFKQATLVSFLVPLMIIGVPLGDTFLAILRRYVNHKPIFTADKGHLHHCLLQAGFSHRRTVLIIYTISAIFGACAIILSQTTLLWVTVLVTAVMLLTMVIGAELIGIISKSRKPVLRVLQKLMPRAIKARLRLFQSRFRESK